jgi:hypothetical protein
MVALSDTGVALISATDYRMQQQNDTHVAETVVG